MVKNPLEGVRVIEMCSWLTGPIATGMLADQGADVIKVEAPGGDQLRILGTSRGGHAAMFMAVNRNKRAITLDLKQGDHKNALLELISNADVFIQNMKPGVIDKLGFGAEKLRTRFPKLIYASISGYGQTGPNAHEGAYDNAIQALSGLAVIQGDKTRPQLVRSIVCDKIAGPIVAQAISSALFQRERTGEGCLLEYAMLDAMIWWSWCDGMMNQTFMGDEGVNKGVEVAGHDTICQTDDGYIVVLPHQEKTWQGFLEVVGRPELGDDPPLSSPAARWDNLDRYTQVVRESFAGKTTAEWCSLLREKGIPCAPVLAPDEVISYPQVVWNELIQEAEHPEAGRHRTVRAPVLFDGHANSVIRPSPAAGADTTEVLQESAIKLSTD